MKTGRTGQFRLSVAFVLLTLFFSPSISNAYKAILIASECVSGSKKIAVKYHVSKAYRTLRLLGYDPEDIIVAMADTEGYTDDAGNIITWREEGEWKTADYFVQDGITVPIDYVATVDGVAQAFQDLPVSSHDTVFVYWATHGNQDFTFCLMDEIKYESWRYRANLNTIWSKDPYRMFVFNNACFGGMLSAGIDPDITLIAPVDTGGCSGEACTKWGEKMSDYYYNVENWHKSSLTAFNEINAAEGYPPTQNLDPICTGTYKSSTYLCEGLSINESYNIPSSLHKCVINIGFNNSLQNSGNRSIYAEKQIVLKPGFQFTAAPGKSFRAKIE